jgi:hypothetical protein
MQKPVVIATITVATATTRVQVTDASGRYFATSICFQADPANTGNLYIGDSAVTAANSMAIVPGGFYAVTADSRPRGGADQFDIRDFYVDAETSGNKVRVLAFAQKP